MNGKIVLGIFAVLMSVTIFAVCQEEDRDENQMNSAMEEVELRHLQMELEAREAELDFQRQLQQLELDERRAAIERNSNINREKGEGGAPFLLLLAVVHVLLTIWVYQDIKKHSTGSGLWIAITLLSGLFGALVYALVRLGDAHQESS